MREVDVVSTKNWDFSVNLGFAHSADFQPCHCRPAFLNPLRMSIDERSNALRSAAVPVWVRRFLSASQARSIPPG